MLTTLIATIIVLGVLIFIHELGHFVTAKMVDIEVPRFSIGLGPKLWGFRRGETEYVISWLPLGGYVKMAGMEEMEAIEGGRTEPHAETGIAGGTDLGLVTEETQGRRPGPRDFESKSLPARTLVISAGVIMNFLFAILVFTGSALLWGIEEDPDAVVPVLQADVLPAGAEALAAVPAGTRIVAFGDRPVEDWGDLRRLLLTASPGPTTVRFDGAPAQTIVIPGDDEGRAMLLQALNPGYAPIVGMVIKGQPAAVAGLREGDRIVAVDGTSVRAWHEVVMAVRERPGMATDLTVERDGATMPVRIVPAPEEITDADGTIQTIGRIGAGVEIPRERPGLLGAIGHGLSETWNVVYLILDFLRDLFTGDASPRSLGGPIMIGQMSGEVARAGIEAFLSFMAIFSVNLAVLNLLPIPVLDGGHLLFLAIEAVRGRALSFEQRLRFTQVGFIVVVAIMVWAIANDVLRLFGI